MTIFKEVYNLAPLWWPLIYDFLLQKYIYKVLKEEKSPNLVGIEVMPGEN